MALARSIGGDPSPAPAIDATAEIVARLPFLPLEARWIEAFRRPVLMDCGKARAKRGWRPEHDAEETLRQTIDAARPQVG